MGNLSNRPTKSSVLNEGEVVFQKNIQTWLYWKQTCCTISLAAFPGKCSAIVVMQHLPNFCAREMWSLTVWYPFQKAAVAASWSVFIWVKENICLVSNRTEQTSHIKLIFLCFGLKNFFSNRNSTNMFIKMYFVGVLHDQFLTCGFWKMWALFFTWLTALSFLLCSQAQWAGFACRFPALLKSLFRFLKGFQPSWESAPALC